MGPILESAQPRLQKHFLEHTESWIRTSYRIPPDDKILCALWLGGFSRRGFVVTDKALYWNIGSGAARNFDCLRKTAGGGDAEFFVETVLPETIGLSSEQAGADRLTKLTLRMGETEKNFYFKKLDERRAGIVRDILSCALNQGEVPQIDLGEAVSGAKPSKVRDWADRIALALRGGMEKTRRCFASVKCGVQNKVRGRQRKKAGCTESPPKAEGNARRKGDGARARDFLCASL